MDIIQALQQALDNSSMLVVPLVLVGGAATGLNPCVFPTIPVVIGYITGQKEQPRWKGLTLALTFVLGLAITYVIIGATASFVGSVLGISKAGWMYIVAAVCILVGLNMSVLISVSFDTFMPAPSKRARLSG